MITPLLSGHIGSNKTMRELFQKIKLPLILIAVLFAGFIVYNSFMKAPPSKSILKQTSGAAASTTPDRDFLPLLQQIQGVTLDQKLFIDPVFRALADWSQQIIPESIGKQNPFSGQLMGTVKSSVEGLGFTETETSTNVKTAPAKKTPGTGR